MIGEASGYTGTVATKRSYLSYLHSSKSHARLKWFEIGPMDVKVLGNVAVVQGLFRKPAQLTGKVRQQLQRSVDGCLGKTRETNG